MTLFNPLKSVKDYAPRLCSEIKDILGDEYSSEICDIINVYSYLSKTDSFDALQTITKIFYLGFELTLTDILRIADISALFSMPYVNFCYALLDAQTGKFERLKEFGIRILLKEDSPDNVGNIWWRGKTEEIRTLQDIPYHILKLCDHPVIAGTFNSLVKTRYN